MNNLKKKIGLKYDIQFSSSFKADYKRIKKQGKDINKMREVIFKLANGEELGPKYKNHILTNSKHYKNCGECLLNQTGF